MLFRWIALILVVRHLQCLHQLVAGIARHDDLVYEATLGSAVRVGELAFVLLDNLLLLFGRGLTVEDVHRTLGTHHVVYIPVLVTFSGLNDVVYNDFHIGKNASAIIVAGCAVKNNAGKTSRHQGIHRFYLEENASVSYLEKHYGEGHGHGGRILDPVTEMHLGPNSTMDMDTVQIEGVTDTVRYTTADLSDGATLTISEKIMTSQNQTAKTEFTINLNGKNSSTHVVSRSIAADHSHQQFFSHLNGYNECYGHVECDGILKDQGIVDASPEVNARHVDARLVHEAAIGKIAGDQLTKLMSLGLTAKEAEKAIIDGFLK